MLKESSFQNSNACNKFRDEKIVEWLDASKKLAEAKEQELLLRNEVIKLSFKNPKESGTENVELGNGYKLKAVFKLNYRLNNLNDGVNKAIQQIEKLEPQGSFITQRLIKWKPELSITEYNKLDSKVKDIINEVVISYPGTPSLELVSPSM